ncbi:alternative sigma factor SigF, partial [Mycobacterium montefiorense]
MTEALAPPRPTRPAKTRNDDSYDDVIAMFL